MTSVAAEDEVIMRIGVLQKPDSLNPYKMTLSIGYTINFLLYDTLNSINETLDPGAQLADSWEKSPDGLTWTFHINQNAWWHDGEKVTAHDVNFSLNLVLDNQKACALWVDYLNGVDSVRAIDDYTVEIVTLFPKANMLSSLVPIVPEHLWSKVEVSKINKVDPWDPKYFPDGPIGSGPLTLDEYDATLNYIWMSKNPNYHIDTVKVDRVLFRIFSTDTAMVYALQNKQIDVAVGVPARLWTTVLGYEDVAGQAGKALSIFELGINCATPEIRESFPDASENLETTNVSVRRAIAMATNKDYIVNDIMNGLADVGDSIIPTATEFWHYYVPENERWDFDIAGAIALLEAANYRDTDGDGIRNNATSGVELEFSFYYRNDKPDDELAADRISKDLLSIGIKAPPTPISEGNMYNKWLACSMDLFIWAWDTDVDPNFMLSTQTTYQIPEDPQDFTKWSDSFWSNASYDSMYIEQQKLVDPNERRDMVLEMQELLYRECPYVVLYYPLGLYAYTTEKFTNYPDWLKYPGMTPGTMWFFFEVTPVSNYIDPMPPENVNAGSDQTCVVGETLSFTGDADDPNNPTETLNWTWSFTEPDDTEEELWGRTVEYTFNQVGLVEVMLTVRDPDDNVGVDDLVVTVTEPSEDQGWLKGYVYDQDSAPIVGAAVNAGLTNRTTDSTGYYSMAILYGDYTVNASKTGYSTESVDATVVAGETTWANITLTVTSGTLTVRVLDAETGTPITSASVNISYGGISKRYVTLADGNTTFYAVDAGSVSVNVSKAGYKWNETSTTVVAGETTVLVVELTPEPEEKSNIALVAAVVIALIVVALIAALLLMKRKKGGSTEEAPPPPDAPGPQ